MRTCYWCYWGWPHAIRVIYETHSDQLLALVGHAEVLHHGPGHCVWEDENFNLAAHLVEVFDSDVDEDCRFTTEELVICRQSLIELAAVDPTLRTPPMEYDGEHPDRFPPPESWRCKRLSR